MWYLGLDAIISGHDQDHQVCDRSATSSHGGEGCMAWCIQEGDALVAVWHGDLHNACLLISDVLACSDTTIHQVQGSRYRSINELIYIMNHMI